MKKIIIPTAVLVLALIVSLAILFKGDNGPERPKNIVNTKIVDGTQYIDIFVRGGYEPRYTTAKANIPTVIRMETSGTYDCSAALTIPKLNYRKNLLPNGVTEIEVPPQEPGTTLSGTCTMGMYNFSINFE